MSKRPQRVDILIGQNIRMRRLQRGLTQSELGDHLGITPQQIQKYENGANRVGASRLNQIAGALAVSVAALFDGRPSNGNGHARNGRATPDLSGGALLANPHGLRLARAFDEILGTRKRIAILRLVETIANGRSRHRPPGRGRTRLH